MGKKEESKNEKKGKMREVRLVGTRKGYNGDIVLARFRMSLEAIRDSILSCDEDILNEERLNQLLKIAPTQLELDAIDSYSGPVSNLGFLERFYLRVMNISRPPLEIRLTI